MYHYSLKMDFVELAITGLAGSIPLTTENFAQKLAADRIALVTEKVCNALALSTERIAGRSCKGAHCSGRAVDASEYAAKAHSTTEDYCVLARKNFAFWGGEGYRAFARTVVGKACFEHPIFRCFFVRGIQFCGLLRRATGKQNTAKSDQCFRSIHLVFHSMLLPILVCVTRNLQFFTFTTSPKFTTVNFWCGAHSALLHLTSPHVYRQWCGGEVVRGSKLLERAKFYKEALEKQERAKFCKKGEID